MMPTILRLQEQGFPIVKIDVGAAGDLSKRYEINTIPTILIKRGPKVARLTGLQEEQSLRSTLLQNEISDNVPGLAKEHPDSLVTIVYRVGLVLRKPEPRNGPMPAARPDLDPLLHLIQTAIEPESWDEAGGPGRIMPLDKNLSILVLQTPRIHTQIRFLLKEVHKLQIEAREQEVDESR
jgi:hypothetical protein